MVQGVRTDGQFESGLTDSPYPAPFVEQQIQADVALGRFTLTMIMNVVPRVDIVLNA